MKIYIIFINIFEFLLFFIDKQFSKQKIWRIPEIIFFILAIIGGSIGGIVSMKLFHHKTLKKKFSLGLPIILIIQIMLLFLLLMN